MRDAPFCHHFRDLFRRSIFGCIFGRLLASFRLPFGSLWFPLAALGYLLAPFWYHLAHFCPPFSHFGAPRRHFLYFYDISMKFLDIKDFPATSHQNTSFLCSRTCEATANDRVHPHLCKAHNCPRPGAGILPQATEIRFWSDLRFPWGAKMGPYSQIIFLKIIKNGVPRITVGVLEPT